MKEMGEERRGISETEEKYESCEKNPQAWDYIIKLYSLQADRAAQKASNMSLPVIGYAFSHWGMTKN